jgi:hypothetical protein
LCIALVDPQFASRKPRHHDGAVPVGHDTGNRRQAQSQEPLAKPLVSGRRAVKVEAELHDSS